jgi:hypothetical protein
MPRKRTTKQTKLAAPAPRSRHGLRNIFEEQDIAQQVFNHMSAEQLCLCSIVCKSFKNIVDTSMPLLQKFAQDLQWHGGAHVWSEKEEGIVRFNKKNMQFNHDIDIRDSSRLLLWRYNVDPLVGIKIRMRVHFHIPLYEPQQRENPWGISVSGCPTRVQLAYERGRVSIDATEWKILSITEKEEQPDSTFLGRTVRLRSSVSDFTCNDGKLRLLIPFPIVFLFHNVPVAHKPLIGTIERKLTYRMLWVMRGIRQCMHCHQRPSAFQSHNAVHAEHSVLCTHCCDLLYVREEQLRRKWKINTAAVTEVRRVHFVECFQTTVSYVTPRNPLPCLCKRDIATLFGHDSWAGFIQNNHLRKTSLQNNTRWPAKAEKAKFYFRNRWF